MSHTDDTRPEAAVTAIDDINPDLALKTAREVAAAPWCPPVRTFEISRTDNTWIISAELDTDVYDVALRWLNQTADARKVEFVATSDRTKRLKLEYNAVPVEFWWMNPTGRWIVGPCATCGADLSAPGTEFVKIGEREYAVAICIPCQTAMHSLWLISKDATQGEATEATA